MKIRVRVLRIKAGGTTLNTIAKKDLRMMEKLLKSNQRIEIEYIFDKFTPKK